MKKLCFLLFFILLSCSNKTEMEKCIDQHEDVFKDDVVGFCECKLKIHNYNSKDINKRLEIAYKCVVLRQDKK